MKTCSVVFCLVTALASAENLWAQTSVVHVAGVLVKHDASGRAEAVTVNLVFGGTTLDSNATSQHGLYSLFSTGAVDDVARTIGIRIANDTRYDDLTRAVFLSSGSSNVRRGKAPDYALLSRNRPSGDSEEETAVRLANAQVTEYYNVEYAIVPADRATDRLEEKFGEIWAASKDNANINMYPQVLEKSESLINPEIRPALNRLFELDTLRAFPGAQKFRESNRIERHRLLELEQRGKAALNTRQEIHPKLLSEMLSIPPNQIPQSWEISEEARRELGEHLNQQVIQRPFAGATLLVPRSELRDRPGRSDGRDILRVPRNAEITDREVSNWIGRSPEARQMGVLMQLRKSPVLSESQVREVQRELDMRTTIAVPAP
jgi:hypothetical protein